MHIIFDIDSIDNIKDNNVLLELDTFYLTKLDQTKTAYCVLENIRIEDLNKIPHLVDLHNQLMSAYKNQQFKHCLNLLPALVGSFNGEVDTFYEDLKTRIVALNDQQLPNNWSPTIVKDY